MCRSIVTLRGAEPVSDDEVRAAALQFVRTVSGHRAPSLAHREVTASSRRLLGDVVVGRP